MKRLVWCAALVFWSTVASAVVYKWTDDHGKIQYGDRPPDGVHAEVVQMLGVHTARLGATNQIATPSASSSLTGTGGTSSSMPKSSPGAGRSEADDARKSVDADVAQTRDKQCTEAQDRYKKLIEGRKLYKSGPDGERQYLTSDEIDTERLNAKHDIDQICNSTT